VSAIKVWQSSDDTVLALLCKMLMDRRLPKVKLSNQAFSQELIDTHTKAVATGFGLSEELSSYFVYTGILENTTYSSNADQIKILYKNGSLSDISTATENYGVSAQSSPTVKYFLCYPK
jgi:hypothetical protein